MSTVPQRGRIIYDWFKDNPGRHTKEQWLIGAGLDNSGKTDAGLKYARGIAIANGEFIPMAEGANGNTYVLTDQPSECVDAELATARQARGMSRWHESHMDFMAEHGYSGLTASERKFVKARLKKINARRAEDDADSEMEAAVIGMRREMRAQRDGQEED